MFEGSVKLFLMINPSKRGGVGWNYVIFKLPLQCKNRAKIEEAKNSFAVLARSADDGCECVQTSEWASEWMNECVRERKTGKEEEEV